MIRDGVGLGHGLTEGLAVGAAEGDDVALPEGDGLTDGAESLADADGAGLADGDGVTVSDDGGAVDSDGDGAGESDGDGAAESDGDGAGDGSAGLLTLRMNAAVSTTVLGGDAQAGLGSAVITAVALAAPGQPGTLKPRIAHPAAAASAVRPSGSALTVRPRLNQVPRHSGAYACLRP